MLKIKFVDFWPGFDSSNNYFYTILGGPDEVKLSDNPDILFFSNFGNEHLKYTCFRIFFSSENERANMMKCDIAFTFDISKNRRQFRLPLYILFAYRYNYNPFKQSEIINKNDFIQTWKNRNFCCMVVSNGLAKERIDFFNFLSTRERIDSGGKFLNNIGKNVEDKLEFISNYKFVISFENSNYPGYTTEKLFEPFLSNSIPVYWGNSEVNLDFHSNSFINVSNFNDFNAAYNRMKEIESNDKLIESYLFSNKIVTDNYFWDSTKIKTIIISNYNLQYIPVGKKKMYKFLSFFIDKYYSIKYWFRFYTIGTFR